MTGFAIAEYLIVVLEVFLICDVSARGLKPERVKQVFRQLRFLYSKAAFWHCFCGQ